MQIKISTERKQVLRFIRKKKIRPIGNESIVTTPTDHTHDNKADLDKLSVDSSDRLLISGNLVDPILRQEDW